MAVIASAGPAAADPVEPRSPPLFDGHIHYNRSVWEAIRPDDVIDRLVAGGIQRAFVSSTPTEGTEQLFERAPTRVFPLLRPYRSPADRRTWFADPTLVPRLRERLESFPYLGIGEFHVFGADASTPVMRQMIELAAERGLILHAHADEYAIVRIVKQAPELTVIWAHAGFDVPVERLAELLERHPRLLMELSYRGDIAPEGELSEDWRALFTKRPERFLVGMDTHVGGRWAELDELAEEARGWLAQLPTGVAHRIAFQNAVALANGDPSAFLSVPIDSER